jgi:NADH:ubiquinone oxidoreductase subunit 4 (subunit M)
MLILLLIPRRQEMHQAMGEHRFVRLLLSRCRWCRVSTRAPGYQMVERATGSQPWREVLIGVDGSASAVVMLTPSVSGVSPRGTRSMTGSKEYYAMFLLLAGRECSRIHVLARLLPVLRVLEAGAGADVLHHRRVGRARGSCTPAIKFFLYTLAGSS